MSLLQRIDLAKLTAWASTRPFVRSGRLKVPAAAEIATLIYWSSDWKTYLIGKILKARDGVFIDVGANIGQTLVDYEESGQHNGYIGFEPSPRCIDIVTSIIKANNLRDAVLIPTGLSDVSKLIPFYIRPDLATDSTATMVRDIRPEDPFEVVYVPVYPFDEINAEVIGKRQIALIKIDVEGGELNVLRGMRKTLETHEPWIICEVLHRDLHADATKHAERCRNLMTFIEEVGYSVYRIGKDGAGKRVISLVLVTSFPEIIYGPDNMHDCDYLFVPDQQIVDQLI